MFSDRQFLLSVNLMSIIEIIKNFIYSKQVVSRNKIIRLLEFSKCLRIKEKKLFHLYFPNMFNFRSQSYIIKYVFKLINLLPGPSIYSNVCSITKTIYFDSTYTRVIKLSYLKHIKYFWKFGQFWKIFWHIRVTL